MHNHDKEYWKQYYKAWDDFVRNWFDSEAHPTDTITREYQRSVRGLDLNELPEPYLGNPHEGTRAVFVNLNPGGSFGELVRLGNWKRRNFIQIARMNREDG